jgi:hypothetical protein
MIVARAEMRMADRIVVAWVALAYHPMHRSATRAGAAMSVGNGQQSQQWNLRRGLIRIWIVLTAGWLIVAGALWLVIWWNTVSDAADWVYRSIVPVDYEAICARLRAQQTLGKTIDPIPTIPAIELRVTDGVGKIIGAPGRCLVPIAQQAGIELIPVAFHVVETDGSRLQEIEGADGRRRPMSSFPAVPPVRDETIFEHDRERMFLSLGLILTPPLVLFVIGYGVWWAASGFKPNPADVISRREPHI